jgi:hypothetical protein
MQSDISGQSVEIVSTPTGRGWRVQIVNGNRLHFVGGFSERAEADDWIRFASKGWLATLKQAADFL